MSVWALGINHHTAPLDLRGRFAFALDQIQPTLNGYRQSLERQPEATLLSTCNRTELYGAGDQAAVEPTLEWLAHTGGVSTHVLRDHAYVLREDQAARHAFRVASGLDSMVLGDIPATVFEGEAIYFTIQVRFVTSGDEDLYLVSFVEEKAAKPGFLAASDEDSRRQLRELERELEAAHAELLKAVQSRDALVLEQKAINDEALSVNEEFQSTNEELLTSKEELQSLNEELIALNSQLQETLENFERRKGVVASITTEKGIKSEQLAAAQRSTPHDRAALQSLLRGRDTWTVD